MVDQVKILTARRAYVFHPDDLRLTSLSVAGVPDTIRSHFNFQSMQIGTPSPSFGPVPTTLPPGLAFNLGTVPFSDGFSATIRFMHFEPQRIVIDVAGPSTIIDHVYETLQNLLREVRVPDGSPAIGEPAQTIDYSEISARLSFGIEKMISKPMLALAQRTFAENNDDVVIPATVIFQVANPLSEIEQPASGQAILQIRAGTRPSDNVYFSNMDTSTDQNLAWLENLDKELGSSA